jgi:drug/metabolite transporter (DMT)-like permease
MASGAGAGVGRLVGLLFVVLGVAITLWTYSDAQENSPHSAVLWALVVFFGGLLGILLYFVIGRDEGAGRGGGVAY